MGSIGAHLDECCDEEDVSHRRLWRTLRRRVAGWFAGGMWCRLMGGWLWIRYGRDPSELPGLLWGGVVLVIYELVMNSVTRRHDATS